MPRFSNLRKFCLAMAVFGLLDLVQGTAAVTLQRSKSE
jgi:hypothetical protein